MKGIREWFSIATFLTTPESVCLSPVKLQYLPDAISIHRSSALHPLVSQALKERLKVAVSNELRGKVHYRRAEAYEVAGEAAAR